MNCFLFSEMKNLHINVLKLVGFLSSCKNKIMKAHDVFYFIKLKIMISPCKEIWQSWILNSVPWILHSGFFVSGTWILDSNYKWDPEYLTFISVSKRKISQIPDSLRWGDSDPKINTFSVKPKPVNWASNYCRLSVHVVLVTACCSCHHMLEKGVCGPGEIVAGIVVFQNQLGMIMKQL